MKHLISGNSRLKLSGNQRFWHYSIVPLLLLVPVLSLFFILKARYFDGTTARDENELLTLSLYFIAAALVFYFIQRRRLRFKKFRIKLNVNQFKKTCEQLAEKSGWRIIQLNDTSMIAIAPRSWRSWGERVTIIRQEQELWFNSICDPHRRPSFSSLGKNRNNLNAFLNEIEANT